MCIIIDTNTLSLVFNPETLEHDEFKPVFDWIHNGKGKIVHGGTKYENELKKAGKAYLDIIKYYNDMHKAVHICDERVDVKQDEIERKVNDPRFNDSHLVAIVCVSKCKLICSNDKSAYPFLKNRNLYQKNGAQPPKIYSRKNHKNLLTDSNIADCCKPCLKMTRKQREESLSI